MPPVNHFVSPLQPAGSACMIGSSSSMQDLKLAMARVASSNCTVLITGETGTGKELAAEFIHQASPRARGPFVCINCAAIPDSLIESELFGHTRGAYTGADDRSDGLLSSANGGTVFLDEIGDMSLFAQAKILRVLEKKEVCRIGGTRSTLLDIRFLAATNQDLEALSLRGGFRRDLFFRLNVARIHLSPLRERREDIPALLAHYCREFRHPSSAREPDFSAEAIVSLLQYAWPGNIRELRNVVEILSLEAGLRRIDRAHLPAHLRVLAVSEEPPFGKASPHIAPTGKSTTPLPQPPAAPGERDSLITALATANGNKSEAAKRLHWSRMTLYRKIAKHKLSPAPSPEMGSA
jgi:DNA-binding NtrC family response regulator